MFAKLNLSDDEYRLYAQMYAPIAAQLPRARSRRLAAGVGADAARRGCASARVAMEHGIDLAYLDRLCDAYVDFFASYDGAPVFVVDTERFHPLERDGDLDELIAGARAVRRPARRARRAGRRRSSTDVRPGAAATSAPRIRGRRRRLAMRIATFFAPGATPVASPARSPGCGIAVAALADARADGQLPARSRASCPAPSPCCRRA